MTIFLSRKGGSFWRTDGFIGVLVVMAVILLHLTTDIVGTLERRFYDFASTSTSRKPSDRIAVIAIDDQSIANIGRWPWSRDVHARLIDQLAAAKAKTIVHTVFFFEPQIDPGLSFIRKMKELLPSADDLVRVSPPVLIQLAGIAAQAESALDTDRKLADSFKNAASVVIPSIFTLGLPQGRSDGPLPAYVLKYALEDANGFSVAAVRSQQPLENFGLVAVGVGHLNQIYDVDGSLRHEPLLVNYYGQAIPSISLLAATHSLNLTTNDINLNGAAESVQVGHLQIKTDANALMLPQFYKERDGKPAFVVDSFYDVLTGKIPATKYTDKIVIIGATAAGVGKQFPVPGNPALSSAEAIAHTISSILNEHFIVQPSWSLWSKFGTILVIAAYIIVALPRLSARAAAVATGLIFVILLGFEFVLLSSSALWLEMIFPAVLLVLGHLALTTKRFLVTEAGKLKSDEESAETNRMMGLALQGQGQLDMAFDRFRRVPMADPVMGNLYTLALDFERKRQFNKAEAVYQHMAAYNQDYKDLKVKLNRVKNLSETVMLGGNGSRSGTLLLDGGAVEKPMLGRYQIEKELGKGAMGVVYLGKDPKIGRVVAIKTMALAEEFEGSQLVDARERFFREAETAGRLQHQHIVTIFDAGEEHDLAYIAMEFLKGRDLVNFCKTDNLLPVPTVLSIVARVAEALSYAHRQHVVHRDIKPANIMYETETDTVKVTDFGIARITDSSKTKTGLVLGTPSFMSPEQIAGKKVDGRSDLYSLGVMLFQMLTGTLPLRGESMAELMYKIANEEAPDARTIRPELTENLARLMAFSLNKNPQQRYQDGDQFAKDLRAVSSEYATSVEETTVFAAITALPKRPGDTSIDLEI